MGRTFFLWGGLLFTAVIVLAAGERTEIAGGEISIILPDGWAESHQHEESTLAGFVSSDDRSSVFFRKMDSSVSGSMSELMERTIANFEVGFEITGEDENYKTGQVKSPGKEKWPAIYTSIEAKIEAKPRPVSFQFYLMIFDTGSALYFVQASTTKPIRPVREKQIMALIQSIVARSGGGGD